MTNYNDGKWHGWDGGECPVHPYSVIEGVYLFNGTPCRDKANANVFDWGHDDEPIIAFRVIKEHKEPREFWLCGYTICTNENAANRVNVDKHDELMEIIHVREVLE